MSEPTLDYKVKLEVFEGPLDLLLYLIRKEEIDVWDIPISRITEQYLQYLDLMRELNLDVAGEFILMAATLAHIKSRELLPPNPSAVVDEEDEGDPRAELVRRLLEYQKYKNAAEELALRPLLGRDTFGKGEASVPDAQERKQELLEMAASSEVPPEQLDVSVFALLDAFKRVIARIPPEKFHEIQGETISVADKAKWLAGEIIAKGKLRFHELFPDAEQMKKSDVVATFLALLEMVRQKLLAVHQAQVDGEIEIESKIPAGMDVAAVISGADLDKAFAYGVNQKNTSAVAAPSDTEKGST